MLIFLHHRKTYFIVWYIGPFEIAFAPREWTREEYERRVK
jgi:hypothetical protein